MQEPTNLAIGQKLGLKNTMPSSGFTAVEMIRHCAPAVMINIYGMNWSPANWEGHSVSFPFPISLGIPATSALLLLQSISGLRG